MSLSEEADELARALFEARGEMNRAGRALHDNVAPILAAAGLRLQLLRMDHPQAAEEVDQTLLVLDDALELVRALGQAMNPSPAERVGLENALSQLVAHHQTSFAGTIRLSYNTQVKPLAGAAVAIYEAAAVVLEQALRDASTTVVNIRVSGTRHFQARVSWNGRGKAWRRAMAAQARRACPAGVLLEATTRKGTIVSIRYAARRSARG
jgi:signal transduction histidine kinase